MKIKTTYPCGYSIEFDGSIVMLAMLRKGCPLHGKDCKK